MAVSLSVKDRLSGRDGRRRESRRDAGIPVYFRTLRFEPMEERALLSADVQFHHIVFDPAANSVSQQVAPLTVISSMTPAQIRTAYGIDQIAGDGTGQTIAIVDAYDNPNVASDLQFFSTTYSLPAANFTKLNQYGVVGSYPAGDTGWGLEIALDVQWAHAVAPGASIILVEANSTSFSDLLTAVDTARNYSGVSVVSMSWGSSGEFNGETFYDWYFTTPSGHTGVTFLASTGDSGWPGSYPAYSPTVVAVGGTTLSINTSTYAYSSETGWSGSGGGISQYENQPSYQNGVVTQSTTKRTIPDVAFDADPSSGVSVYDTYGYGGWLNVGGTSFSAPAWAGLIAIANQLRVLQGLSTLNGPSNPTQTHALLYGLAGTPGNYNPSGDYHDVTSGSNGHGQSAVTGYDLVTGIGSPVANLLVPALAPTPVPPPTTFYSANMDVNPGWTYQGQWAWGQPTGGAGTIGGPDPTSGHTGSNVVGYNLAGGYANNMTTTYWATTTAIDSSAYTGVTLDFWRWLGVERSNRDHAYVQVSNNGTTWTTVWQNSNSDLNETAWSEQTYDISAVADRQSTVYIRWGMGSTNLTRTYCGWNIDDVTLAGTPVADTTPPTVSSLTPNPATVADANVGTAGFTLTVAFNEAMNIAVAPTISFPVENPAGTLNFNGGLSGWSNSTTYVARFDVADSNVKLQYVDVRATGAKDAAGNTQNQADFADVFSIDTQNPMVTSSTPSTAGPTSTDSLTFTVSFDETVSNVTTDDFRLTRTGAATGTIAGIDASSGTSFTVTVDTITGEGTLRLDLKDNTDVQDAAGNTALAYTSGSTVTIDRTRTWDGGGTDSNWMTAANWVDDVAPVAGDRLVFAGATQTLSNNNFPDETLFDNITFTGGGFTLSGNSVTLSPVGGVAIDNILGQNRIDLPIAIGSTGTTIVQAGTLELGPAAQALVLSGDGADIQGGKLVLDYTGESTPAALVKSLLTASYDAAGAARFDTGKFQSSTADATHGLGWLDDAATSKITVAYTIYGDADLNGTVGASDLGKVLVQWGVGTNWLDGDFDYNGVVGASDLGKVLVNWGLTVGTIAPIYTSATVPQVSPAHLANTDFATALRSATLPCAAKLAGGPKSPAAIDAVLGSEQPDIALGRFGSRNYFMLRRNFPPKNSDLAISEINATETRAARRSLG